MVFVYKLLERVFSNIFPLRADQQLVGSNWYCSAEPMPITNNFTIFDSNPQVLIIRGKQLNVYGEFAESIQPYSEYTRKVFKRTRRIRRSQGCFRNKNRLPIRGKYFNLLEEYEKSIFAHMAKKIILSYSKIKNLNEQKTISRYYPFKEVHA